MKEPRFSSKKFYNMNDSGHLADVCADLADVDGALPGIGTSGGVEVRAVLVPEHTIKLILQ